MNEIDIIYRNSLKFPPSNPRKKELLQQVQRGRNRPEEDKELAQVRTGYKPELRVQLEPKHRVFGLFFIFFSTQFFLNSNGKTQTQRQFFLTYSIPGAKCLLSQEVSLSQRKRARMSLRFSQQCYQGNESPWLCFAAAPWLDLSMAHAPARALHRQQRMSSLLLH